MLDPTDLDRQLDRAAGDPQRVLIVGAGIAGVTLAQLLRRRGRHPVLIERAGDDRRAGYMLALMPMVDAALDELGVREEYRAASVPFSRYALHDRTGALARVDRIGDLLARYGDYRGIGRTELMDALSTHGCDVTFGTTVGGLEETRDAVTVTLTGPQQRVAEFDLVVIADGLRSSTRELVPGGRDAQVVGTGWGGWVVWAPVDDEPDRGDELWGTGFFVGAYPVKGRIGVFLGGPADELQAGAPAFAAGVRDRLRTIPPRIEAMLTAVEREPDPYYWALDDARARDWTTRRTVLLGDAAAGFLPTAGIGAGMAIESAWVLAGRLRATERGPGSTPGGADLAAALRAYEAAQRPRVRAAQDSSRRLGKLMFHRSRLLAIVRDLAMRVVSVGAVIGPISRLLRDAPRPESFQNDESLNRP